MNLSPREHEVLELVGKGLSNKSVAIVLGISPETVATHLCHIYRKLGAHNRTHAVAVARSGLVRLRRRATRLTQKESL